MNTRSILAMSALALASVGLPAQAQWTLPRGDVALVAGYDFQFASQEFRDGHERPVDFPLNGRYSGSTLTLGARAGFTDRLELEILLPIKLVSFTADPVILLEPGMSMGSNLDFYQENIIDLSQTRRGLGDIYISGRYSLLRNPIAMALEAKLKTPTGYQGPQGTFGPNPTNSEAFEANVGNLVRPGNVSDDVTLGDGQVDLTLSALVGASFPTRTFMRFDAGYNIRFGGAGDQLVGSLKIGQLVASRLLLYVESRLAYTVTEGRVYGVSVAAIDPSLPAVDYQGLDNLFLREIRLERDAIDVVGGAIVRITDEVEVNVGYSRTVWGRNTAAINAVYVGVGVRASLLEPPPTPEEEAYPEEEYVEEEYEVAPPEDEAPVEAPVEAPTPTPAGGAAGTAGGAQGPPSPPLDETDAP